MARVISVLFATLCLGGCGDKDSEEPPADDTGDEAEAWAPSPPFADAGPWSTGTLEETITGSTGVELTVQAWFPADTVSGDTVVYDGLWDGEAYEDATPACEEPRPVLLFSHGYGGIRWQSTEITEHLATHGYIVVAPDHTANTFLDNDDSRFFELIERRPADIADSFDWLLELDALTGCVDPAAGYAVAGHSFGGYTTFAVAGAPVNLSAAGGDDDTDLSDSRVWAAVPMAPWDSGGAIDDRVSEITVPVMTLSGTLDATTTWAQVGALHDALTVEPRHLGEFVRAGHFSFSPLACDFGLADDGCGDDYIALDEFIDLVNASTLAFLESVRTDPAMIDHRAEESDELIWTDVP